MLSAVHPLRASTFTLGLVLFVVMFIESDLRKSALKKTVARLRSAITSLDGNVDTLTTRNEELREELRQERYGTQHKPGTTKTSNLDKKPSRRRPPKTV